MPPAPKKPAPDNIFAFTLGREAELRQAELISWFRRKKIKCRKIKLAENQRLIAELEENEKNFEPQTANRELGGIVKIAKKILAISEPSAIADYLLAEIPTGKIIFSLHETDQKIGISIKKILKDSGRSARFVPPKNSATILYNNLIDRGRDLTILDGGVFATVAIQPFAEMSKRDYERPGRDDLSGMLPPKLAMIMINLAEQDKDSALLDPFCGSGTVITEAMLMGYQVISGCDVSAKAVADSEKNIAWLRYKPGTEMAEEINIFTADATQLSASHPAFRADFIVTEPYLGKPLTGRESATALEREAAELKKLYFAAFVQFRKILPAGGAIIFIMPEFQIGNKKIAADAAKEIEEIGFEISPLLPGKKFIAYHRPGQHLSRRVYKFIRR